ncbi:hypothetical protein Tco_0344959 [Tanacetum coccineum]
MGGEMVAWCCCWWQHGGCEGGAAAAVTVDGRDGDDRDGVAVTCGGVKAAGDDGVEGVVVRGDGIGGVVLSGGDGDGMMWVVAAVAAGGGGRRVEARGKGDRIDRKMGTNFAFGRKSPPENFSGGGGGGGGRREQ